MIRLMLGKMGSGKTACMVREIIKRRDQSTTFTNIVLKGVSKSRVETIKRDMIFKEEVVKVKQNGEAVTKKVLNSDFWKEQKEESDNALNVVLDEAHTLIDSRRSMSTENVVMNDFLALLRRILGDSEAGYGELVLITQLGRRLDVNARELATSVHYHVAHYIRTCKKCGYSRWENNEMYDYMRTCPRCGHWSTRKHSFLIEKWEFESVEELEVWLEHGVKRYQKHYYVTDIENYFQYYDTFQWENLISEY